MTPSSQARFRPAASPLPAAPPGTARAAVAGWAGLVNLRDVGDPVGPVCAGLLYRSDAPACGDPRPALTIWPPATVLDLRSPAEHQHRPHPLDQPGTSVIRMPLAGSLIGGPEAAISAVGAAPTRATFSLARLYERVCDEAAGWLPGLLGVAAAAPAPILIHCTAGKDRTGIAVALLLAAAGIERSVIRHDYLRSRAALPALTARLARLDPAHPVLPEHLAGLDPHALDAVLDRLGPDPVTALHRQARVSVTDLERWRNRLHNRPTTTITDGATA